MGFLSSILCCLGEKKSSEPSTWDKQLTGNHYLRNGIVHSNNRRHRVQSHSNSTINSSSCSNSSSCDYRYSSHSPVSIQDTSGKHKGFHNEREVDTHSVKVIQRHRHHANTRQEEEEEEEEFLLHRGQNNKDSKTSTKQEGHKVLEVNDSGPKKNSTPTRYSDSTGGEYKLLVEDKEDTHLDQSNNNNSNNTEEMTPYVGPSKSSQIPSYTHDATRQFVSRNSVPGKISQGNGNNNNDTNNRYNGSDSGDINSDNSAGVIQRQQPHNEYNPETKVGVVTVSRSATSEDSNVSDLDEIEYQTSQQQQQQQGHVHAHGHGQTASMVIDESVGNGDMGTHQAYHVSTADSSDIAIENDSNEGLDREEEDAYADADEEEEDEEDEDDDNGEEPIPYTDYDYNMIPNYEESGAFIDLTELQPDQYHAPGYSTLLPPREKRFQNRKCLVLDLDETLVHSSFKYLHSADFILPVDIDNQIHNVYVIKRPGVDEFLKKVGELYEVVVFTASVSRYGDPLLEKLDIYHSVHHRLFREACYNYEGNYIKNLSQIGRPLSEIIILDNSPASYIFHPQHAIPISSWFSDTHDNELLDIIPLLEDLAKENVLDVGKVLDVSI